MKTMATAVAYNRLHNSSVGMGGMGHHTQLARSLERILEEAHFSGELILTNRKLKDFPKTGTKYDLTDTVIADLSRNRFCELPEEVTTFPFLETLLLYHNSIRSIPESLKRLTSLTYLDLRSNQLSSLPKEICSLPLQVLLVSNNRLTTLPDELGRMDRLTDLDVSYNLLTALPARIGELHSLRAFSLRNNQLMYLPRELSCLTLVSLDVANNRIASLPLEIRQMSSLVVLNLENNPLTSPPASLCVRGLVHVFKFLETQANRDEKGLRAGGNYDGYTTLRRTPRNNNTLELQRVQRFHADTGFNTCDANDKRWSHDLPNSKTLKNELFVRKPSLSSPSSQSSDLLDASLTSSSSTIVDEVNGDMDLDQEDQPTSKSCSPDKEDMDLLLNGKSDKLNKDLDNIQTYKEYKEALKQQRNHEISSVYKSKGDTTPTHSKSVESNSEQENKAPIIETTHNVLGLKSIIKNVNPTLTNGINGYSHNQSTMSDAVMLPKKPIQKVIPSRNIDFLAGQTSQETEKSTHQSPATTFGDVIGYIKPNSPMKSTNGNGNVLLNNANTPNGTLKSPLSNATKVISAKTNRTVTWNHDVPSELLSFTMRREFDRQREETELMTQLRTIIETRLKMTLPDDIGSTLTDGVILCHLANYVRPRSVASIHVPSPGVSKLTMARCRRNVDNFLEACRKIGVDEELICSCVDVVPPNNNNNKTESSLYTNEQEMNDNSPQQSLPNPSAVLKTVAALIAKMEKSTNGKHSKKHFYEPESEDTMEVDIVDMQKLQEQQLKRKQQQYTATDTKEQIVMQINENMQLKSILKKRENNNETLITGCEINCEKVKKIEEEEEENAYVACVENSTKLFQCNNNNLKQYQHHRLVNEKSLNVNENNSLAKTFISEDKNQELPLCVNMSNDVVDGAQEYKLLQLYNNKVDEKYKRPLVTKRIEFFEHSAVNTTTTSSAESSSTILVHNNKSSQSAMEKNIVTPKSSNIFSIYRVADLKTGKTTTNAQKIILNTYKKKLAEDETSFIKHDSNVLTALLSCMFIGTFLLLIFFPLSG